MVEVWKDIKGYEGKYRVSNKGRVKSLERFRKNGFKEYKWIFAEKRYDNGFNE